MTEPSRLFGRPPRDPARIDRVLAAIREAWLAQPDSRLGQLLVNTVPMIEANLFFVEDETLLRAFAFDARPPEQTP